MDDILTYITDLFLGNGIIIILGCFVIGMFLKGSLKKLPNKYIPYINTLVAIVLGFLIPGTYDEEPIVSKIIILAFLGLSSVGFYEAICTAVKNRFSIDINKIYNNIINTSIDYSVEEEESNNQTDGTVSQGIDQNEEWLMTSVPPKKKHDLLGNSLGGKLLFFITL